MTSRALYRIEQFLRALTARVSDEDVTRATRTLTPQAQQLFRRQAAQDQRHALDTYHALQAAGHTNPHLLAAALLHDTGKTGASLSTAHRAIIVLMKRFTPKLLAHLSQGTLTWWNRPIVAHARHPDIGAQWAQEAGCSPLTVALIRRHEEEPVNEQTEQDRLLMVLQAADDAH